MRDWIKFINRGITYSFYSIFFLTPLVLHPKSFELFEFNKLWVVFYISLFILFLWITKMIILKQFVFRRTVLDIPLALFLTSQILSTIFSMEPHVSFWGYYSRFNGGLLSLVTYVFLYYAFVSNIISNDKTPQENLISVEPSKIKRLYLGISMSLGGYFYLLFLAPFFAQQAVNDITGFSYLIFLILLPLGSIITGALLIMQSITAKPVFKALFASLLSGIYVVIWGIPSHFGYDPTCLMFRGSLDVSCWTDAFQPTLRMFSTLGQPNWLAAYMAILIPVVVAFGIWFASDPEKNHELQIMNYGINKKILPPLFLILASLFYICILWSQSQSGLAGFGIGFLLFIAGIFYIGRAHGGIKNKTFKLTLFITIGFALLTFVLGIQTRGLNRFTLGGIIEQLATKTAPTQATKTSFTNAGELGGSDSGTIRLTVWKGALEIAKQHPFFGTGVETFAYAYYGVKPIEHNLLSEWDFLYNKAHNEYLNYLATTGILGLGTYLSIIIVFLVYATRKILRGTNSRKNIILIALVASYVSILVSNFFGFSVVIINLYFFLIPALFIGILNSKEETPTEKLRISPKQIALIIGLGLVCLYAESYLVKFWFADQKYSYGYNLNRAQQYAMALPALTDAVQLLPNEDLYKDELSSNNATIALLLSEQGNSTQAAQFGAQAKTLSDEIITKHPNNIVYYKTRVRVLYALSALDNKYLFEAIDAIKKAQQLAPTDAKIAYNMGLIYNEAGQVQDAIDALKKTVNLKPNYRDPRYALAVYYNKLAKQEKDALQKQQYNNLAVEQLNYILTKISADDRQAKELLQSLQ